MSQPNINVVGYDGNWLVHRAYHAAAQTPDLETRLRVVARMVVGWCFTTALAQQAKHMLLAFDGDAVFRYDIWPLYKFSRKQILDPDGNKLTAQQYLKLLKSGIHIHREPDPVEECRLMAAQLAAEYSIPVFQGKKYEADDALASLSTLPSRFPDEVRKVVLNTKDKDCLQSLNERTIQLYPNLDRTKPPVIITAADLSYRLAAYVHEDAAHWTPLQFRDYQTLIGDSTDDVPPILTHAKARALLNKHGTLKKYFAKPEGKQFYYTHQEALLRNRQLVIMRTDVLDEYSLEAFRYKPRPLPTELSVAPTKALRGAHGDYTGWLKSATRRSLF